MLHYANRAKVGVLSDAMPVKLAHPRVTGSSRLLFVWSVAERNALGIAERALLPARFRSTDEAVGDWFTGHKRKAGRKLAQPSIGAVWPDPQFGFPLGRILSQQFTEVKV